MLWFIGGILAGVLLSCCVAWLVLLLTHGRTLWHAKEQFRRLFQDAPVAYQEIDRHGVVRRVNRAQCKLLGLEGRQILGHPVWEFAAPEEQEATREALQRQLAGQVPTAPEELHHLRRDGTRLTLEIHTTPIRGWRGHIVGLRSAALDITARRRAEETLQCRTEELARKNQELAVALEAAREATDLKSHFLANMSHEIRTPMNGVLGMAELLLTTPLAPEQSEYAKGVLHSAQILLRLINDILDLSKIEAGRLDLERIPFDPLAVVEEVRSALGMQAQAKGLALIHRAESRLPARVHGDPMRLRQILLNLAGNAIKFTARGEVLIVTRMLEDGAEAASLRFSVRDTGIGIPEAQRSRVFEPFMQGDGSTTRKYGGTGLGLAISRQLVELMGGRLELESEPGRGSSFWFDLRLPKCTAEAVRPAQTATPPAWLPPAPPGRYRVLLAEDNPVNQTVAMRILTKAGFEAHAVENGRQALDALAHGRYDLVLMDVQMPEMDGFEATAQIRRLEGALCRIPVIAMTANAMSGDREKCLAAGMDDYISKPVHGQQLCELVRRWAERPPEGGLTESASKPWPGTATSE
jgi:PAS domain S-box-containing protein